MEYPSEDQLNKLISAYNDDYDNPNAEDEMQSSMLQLDVFEKKLKNRETSAYKPRIQETEKKPVQTAQKFSDVKIPELPDHVRRRVTAQRLTSIQETEDAQLTVIREEKAPKVDSGAEVQYLTDSEAVDKKLKELICKNKGLSLALQKEQTGSSVLKEQVERLTRQVEELKRVAGGSNEQLTQKRLEEMGEKCRKAEEKGASLNLRVTSLESELAKALKALKREVGERADIDELLREDGGWVGRAQQIEVLRAKIQRLQSKTDSTADKPPKIKSLTSNGDKTEEIARLRKDLDSLNEDRTNISSKLKSTSARCQTLEEQGRRLRAEAEEQRRVLLEKSGNDDKYIQALKRELAKSKAEQAKENRLWSANSVGEPLQPLKTDYVKKITALEKEVERWRDECRKMEQSSMVSLGKSDNLIDLSRENYRLRLKVHELESRVFQSN